MRTLRWTDSWAEAAACVLLTTRSQRCSRRLLLPRYRPRAFASGHLRVLLLRSLHANSTTGVANALHPLLLRNNLGAIQAFPKRCTMNSQTAPAYHKVVKVVVKAVEHPEPVGGGKGGEGARKSSTVGKRAGKRVGQRRDNLRGKTGGHGQATNKVSGLLVLQLCR